MAKSKQAVIDLIEKALQGKVSLEEFYSTWLKELEGDKFYDGIYRDIENAVEHFPGDFFSGKPKLDIFINSREYQVLKEHLNRLSKGTS